MEGLTNNELYDVSKVIMKITKQHNGCQITIVDSNNQIISDNKVLEFGGFGFNYRERNSNST